MSMREDLEMLQASDAAAQETIADLVEGQRSMQDAMNARFDNVEADVKDLKSDMREIKAALQRIEGKLK